MSWIGDTVAGIKRIIQLDGDVARLQRQMDKAETIVMGHEQRLVRIETLIDVSWTTPQLRRH
ncbi:MAG TPA: hypothetical protein VFQ67_16040 [Allosphingosinicella sp.]|nr:hypothetical protein [Allosphingosinicella sp.]